MSTASPLSRPVDIVLHIGMPKTGTTSIQFFLRDNRERLASLGVLFPKAAGQVRSERLGLSLLSDADVVRRPE
jgi:hypothetical protein